MSVLAPAPDFEANDSFLYAVLGLLAASATVERVVERAAAPEPAQDPGQDPGQEPGADEPVMNALLGAIHLRRRLLDVIASWTMKETVTGSIGGHDISPAPVEDLLR